MLSNNQTELLREVLLGNTPAIEFCEAIFEVSQVWDDIIDEAPRNPAEINKAFWIALSVIPRNRFYQQHYGELQPLLEAAMIDWIDSNDLILSDESQHKAAAYVLRDTLTNIVIHCAKVIGGYEHMRHVSMTIREALYDEPFEDYMREHNNG